jgi:hypothetical protein
VVCCSSPVAQNSHLKAQYSRKEIRAISAALTSHTARLNGRIKMFIVKERGGRRKRKALLREKAARMSYVMCKNMACPRVDTR